MSGPDRTRPTRLITLPLVVSGANGLSVTDPVVAGKGRDLLRAVGQYCSVTITFDAVGQAKVAPADNGAKGGLAQLLLTILEAQKDESWQRLKMCGAADCRWVFVDHSRPGTGRWCAMKDCGNRAKKRAYRERQKQGI